MGWEWTQGGARKDLSYHSDFPQENISHFESFFFFSNNKKSFLTIWRDWVPSFLRKVRKPCTRSLLAWWAGRPAPLGCSTHIQAAFRYENSFKVSQAGSICAGKLKSCKTIMRCLQMIPVTRGYESHLFVYIYETWPGVSERVLVRGLWPPPIRGPREKGDRNKLNIFWVPIIHHAERQGL